MAQSNNYWRRREEENLRANRKTEAEYEKAINDTYKYMLDQIQKEINGFYAKYARAEGITLSEAKRRGAKTVVYPEWIYTVYISGDRNSL